MSRIFVTGDVHQLVDYEKLYQFSLEDGMSLTKDDYLIICGDFGAIWSNDPQDKIDLSVLGLYDDFPWTTLFVDGNHENHDRLDQYPVSEWNGGKVHHITPSIIHLMRGQVFTINGQTFATMGGASSHDKWWRKEGISWWAREMPSAAEYEEMLTNLEKVGHKVDHFISHTGPSIAIRNLSPYPTLDDLNKFFQIVAQDNQIGNWWMGHMHVEADFENYGINFHVLYNRILEIS